MRRAIHKLRRQAKLGVGKGRVKGAIGLVNLGKDRLERLLILKGGVAKRHGPRSTNVCGEVESGVTRSAPLALLARARTAWSAPFPFLRG